jgi:hypothetical protein
MQNRYLIYFSSQILGGQNGLKKINPALPEHDSLNAQSMSAPPKGSGNASTNAAPKPESMPKNPLRQPQSARPSPYQQFKSELYSKNPRVSNFTGHFSSFPLFRYPKTAQHFRIP